MRWLLLVLMILFSHQAAAAFDKCIGVYVGRISIHHQQGIDKVVLMAAKASNHKVDIYTKAQGRCSIGSPGQVFTEIHLSTNP
jgi:hypothetical protein